MTSSVARAMQELLDPWIEEGQRLIRVLRAFLEEYERLQYQADLAERECEQLRELVKELQLKTESSRIERTEIAASLTHFIDEVLVRLRPAAGLEPEIPEGLAEPSRAQYAPPQRPSALEPRLRFPAAPLKSGQRDVGNSSSDQDHRASRTA